MNYCASCGKPLQAGATFCSNCGTAVVGGTTPAAMQGLAQAGLEVQAFNGALVVGRIVGFIVAMAVMFFVVGPYFGEDGAYANIAAFFILAFVGILGGQWATLVLLRR